MKNSVFWDVLLLSRLNVNQALRRNISPPSTGSKNKRRKEPARKQVAFYSGFLLGLFFDPEGVDGMLLRNVELLSADYMPFISEKIELFKYVT
jgi:hypothetical protein